MSKEIYISSTPHETRLAIVENDDLTEIYYERENEYTLAGSIYNGKVTRVLPGMQSSFVDIGLERDAFLYITDFMEEAGDSADFDSDSGTRRSTRDSRGEADTREDARASRDEGTSEADRPALSTSEPRSDRNDRGERGERNDRGDRDGGRRRQGNRDGRGGSGEGRGNRDDRGGNRDRSAEPRGLTAPPAELAAEVPSIVDSGYVEPGPINTLGELGEAAPGADGSRRWRGRRGRRRGRSPVQREESQVLQQPAAQAEEAFTAPTPSRGYQADSTNAEDLEEDFDTEYSESVDLDAASAAPAPPSSPTAEPRTTTAEQFNSPQPRSDSPARDRGELGDRGERSSDRGDRGGRDRNRNDRGGRDRNDRSPRAPRGFAPSRALYGVDAAEADQADQPGSDGPAAEPIILPGERLSKYTKSEDTPATSGSSAQPAVAAPRPSTEFILPGTWDGGNVLPGETIRPRSGGASSEGTAERSDRTDRPDRSDRYGSEGRGSRGRGGDRPGRNDRNDRNDRSSGRGGNRGAQSDRNPSISYAAPIQQAPFRVDTPTSVEVEEQSAPSAIEAEQKPASLTSPETLSTPVEAPTELHHEAAEYEPEEASASLRFDPATRSEFRQSAPAEPEELIEESTETRPADAPISPAEIYPAVIPTWQAPVASAEPTTSASSDAFVHQEPVAEQPPVHSIAHTITPQPDITAEPIHIDASADVEQQGTHEFTSIGVDGEMHSEASAPPHAEVADPTSPLLHEHAVQETSAAETTSLDTASLPQTGQLEEEFVDDEEDFNATTLHASSIEEMDYEEEQTLEGAADLGTMIREMSIDHITQPGEEEEDDEADILEEEDVDDDDLSEEGLDADSSPETSPYRESSEFSSASEYGSEELHSSDDFPQAPPSQDATSSREPERRSSRRDGGGRRDGRGRGDRGRDRGGDRARNTGGSGDRSTSRPGRRDGRHSAQSTNLPAITDLLKPGQEVLVQIAKEPIAKKGARITSHIALPGRFLVFMPTVNHTGVSRKIESDGERRRLKEILLSEKGEASGGFIVRTAAANATEEELRSDLRFLLNLWADIKQRSESSKSPALIYHDLNLVERILRDQVTDTFSAIWVDTETEYERVLRFLQRFQPSLIRRVKLYTKEVPLFEQFGITEEVNKALRSKVWLKSGGSIVINQTEALVAIDINTGKYVGKTARLEDTIVKTNLDAIPEIVRQIRLRDLGGIIIIDFIDMDERKNRHKVMAALEEELKKDRAPSKVLQFNDFGLVAITRKRVKQSLERTLSATCNVCQGTGMTKSPVTVCNDIYIEMRKMHKHLDRGDVMLRVHPDVVKQLKAGGTRWLQEMEEMVGKTILVKSDPGLHPEQFDIH